MSGIAKLVGGQIKKIRNEKGLSQEALGHLASLHPSHMGQIERGERSASIETIDKIVNALDVTFEELFSPLNVRKEFRDNDVLVEILELLNGRSPDDQTLILQTIRTMIKWKDN